MTLYMVIILFIVGLCGIYAFIIWYTRIMVSHMVGNKHALLEFIIQTGEVPANWRKKSDTRTHLKKLDELILYVKTTNLFDDESTRTSFLARLGDVQNQWLEEVAGNKSQWSNRT